jgi:hypothetical protein
MQTEFLIEQGNQHRTDRRYQEALQCYLLAAAQEPRSVAAFNNYGNVTRELGYPAQARPWLEHALRLAPDFVTAEFNLAVAALLEGDYARGWPLYESRWRYEHLSGTLPNFSQPRWQGQDIRDQTILIVGEQGHGDIIQMSRFLMHLHRLGARVILRSNANVLSLYAHSTMIHGLLPETDPLPEFDTWSPIMSLPGVLNQTLKNLEPVNLYLTAAADQVTQWRQRLGPKSRLRVALAWRGRPDSWLNQHKGVPFPVIMDLISGQPHIEWHCAQMDATTDERLALQDQGVMMHDNTIQCWADTAGLLHHCDIVLSADTALAHLGGAMGRPTWIMLNRFAQDWRWLLDRDDSPWYGSVRLFRQSQIDDWTSVIQRVIQYLAWFKI